MPYSGARIKQKSTKIKQKSESEPELSDLRAEEEFLTELVKVKRVFMAAQERYEFFNIFVNLKQNKYLLLTRLNKNCLPTRLTFFISILRQRGGLAL